MKEKYDIIAVGMGPGAVFMAYELIKQNSNKKVLLIEQGKRVEEILKLPNSWKWCKMSVPRKYGGIAMSVEIGMKGRAETVVVQENTAQAAGSGLVPVFATPWMIALMENAAVQAVQSALAEDEGTVGTRLDVTHDAATPIGMKVWAEAEVTAVVIRILLMTLWKRPSLTEMAAR